jgi:hypothetical protein
LRATPSGLQASSKSAAAGIDAALASDEVRQQALQRTRLSGGLGSSKAALVLARRGRVFEIACAAGIEGFGMTNSRLRATFEIAVLDVISVTRLDGDHSVAAHQRVGGALYCCMSCSM